MEISPGLNVIVGENGLGKSHVLKLLYSILKTQSPGNLPVNGVQREKLGKNQLEKQIADELTGNMRPDSLGRLVKRQQGQSEHAPVSSPQG
jgi:ABC-type cobalamin/Fe3+-siderophores transport system ATPase subunit